VLSLHQHQKRLIFEQKALQSFSEKWMYQKLTEGIHVLVPIKTGMIRRQVD
jgi:hypothetical protein